MSTLTQLNWLAAYWLIFLIGLTTSIVSSTLILCSDGKKAQPKPAQSQSQQQPKTTVAPATAPPEGAEGADGHYEDVTVG